jgi:hypothetical protein
MNFALLVSNLPVVYPQNALATPAAPVPGKALLAASALRKAIARLLARTQH